MPAGHAINAPVFPVNVLYEPAGTKAQTEAPDVEYDPGPHNADIVAPTVGTKLPAADAVHGTKPVAEYWPAEHFANVGDAVGFPGTGVGIAVDGT